MEKLIKLNTITLIVLCVIFSIYFFDKKNDKTNSYLPFGDGQILDTKTGTVYLLSETNKSSFIEWSKLVNPVNAELSESLGKEEINKRARFNEIFDNFGKKGTLKKFFDSPIEEV